MAASTYMDWVMFEQLLRERYPDLSSHEAQIKFLHEAYDKLPKDCLERIKPILPHLLKQAPEILGIIGNYCDLPQVTLLSQLAAMARNATTKSIGSDTDAKPSTTEAASNAVPLGAEAMAAGVRLAAENMQKATNSADRVVRQVYDIHVIGKSLVDQISYYRHWMQAVSAIQINQGYKAIQALNEIRDHLGESNSITVSGSGDPDGFAQHVYDFVKDATDNIDETEAEKHRFFVYNPDTDWYGAFGRLIRQNPLPPTFCAKADNLDTLCQYMQVVRTQCRSDIIFHLLIPTWYRIARKEPLHFPDSLQPFQVAGKKHRGKPLVEFNLPAAPTRLLHGVANVLHPKILSASVARGVSTAVTLPAVGWGVNGVCLGFGIGLGAISGAGLLVAIPVWVGAGIPAMSITAPVIGNAVYGALCEEAPRILGSNQRLDRTS